MSSSSDTSALSLGYAEALYEQYLSDPASVPADWRLYFDASGNGLAGRTSLGPTFRPRSYFDRGRVTARARPGNGQTSAAAPAPAAVSPPPSLPQGGGESAALQHRVDQLIRNYRVRGHISAQLDPLGRPRPEVPELDPMCCGLAEADLDKPFRTDAIRGQSVWTLRQIIQRMRNTYCRSIGAQFMHIDDLEVRQWLQERMESTENRVSLSREEQIRIFTRLTDAVLFEEFIQKKFIGAKSFSLEGGESLMPLLDLAFEKAGEQGIAEIIMGMAHRGRLNVLNGIVGKSAAEIFREFEDAHPERHDGAGDVKYHLGHSTDWKTRAGAKIHISLCFNPSHLEYVNPVALGRLRAKQDRSGAARASRGLVLLIHGDAAFAGEGIIQETLNLSQLEGYAVGGTLHVIVNNQVGFTTTPAEGRSTVYATDVAKMLQSPIFHVNGEDPEAVASVVSMALDFRLKFRRDVVIDMYCYRRRGHNEGDEPAFTQPLMYRAIRQRKSVREGYLDHLLQLGGLTREEADAIAQRRLELLEKDLSEARNHSVPAKPADYAGIWAGYRGGPESDVPEAPTGVPRARLMELMEALTRLPRDFHAHPTLERFLKARQEMARGERPLDWSAAEALALATLAAEGYRVRLSGQDTERGTFSQRHAMLHDVQDGRRYMPLQHLPGKQAPVEIYNSPLSESGVLGFEYGYSLDCPDGLVMWEAQFGDFWNVAQPIVDQFILSAEEKWRRLSGVVMLLPHGFEGMGPEHSSARLERFLLSAAGDNVQVTVPSTPAQYFHLLRRQVLRPWRKPLVIMTPKSLLRHPKVVSPLEDLERETFQRVLPDETQRDAKRVQRILLCTGKIYYELQAQRETQKRQDVAIIRVEQLYPLPEKQIQAALAAYPKKAAVYWVQEEPQNMGAWRFLRARFCESLFGRRLTGLTRPASASSATGSAGRHRLEQEALLKRAISGGGEEDARH